MILNKEIKLLKEKALNLRKQTLLMFIKKGEAHLGGSFSMIEINLRKQNLFGLLLFLSTVERLNGPRLNG